MERRAVQRTMHQSAVQMTLTIAALPASGQERFASKPNEDRVGELEALREFLEQAAAAFDTQQQKVLEPVDRLKQLLAAKDKRATLLEMAGETLCYTGATSACSCRNSRDWSI